MKEPMCQSCGMLLAAASDHGTNADGSRNEDYCTHCYQGGAFTYPHATAQTMIDLSAPHFAAAQGISEQAARDTLSKFIPLLKRWA
ncbi:MAG: transcriptional regulator [Paenibacillus sp.]|nr:transcriptional regulator [Paenibacillus sp.]